MALGQFLIRNRHSNQWYGRVIIPQTLRGHFNGKREFRHSLKTADKTTAKRRALEFWIECQNGFEQLDACSREIVFENGHQFLIWISGRYVKRKDRKKAGFITERHRIEFDDVFGSRHVIDLDDPDKEQEIALQLQANATELLDKYKDRPEILDRLLALRTNSSASVSRSRSKPETSITCSEAIDLYIQKLTTQRRKGKKLSQRTLLNYQGRLRFWKEALGQTLVHDLTLKELAEIQTWMTRLPTNYTKKGITTVQAIKLAQDTNSGYATISDKTRAEYLGQLKGFLEYALACGFVATDLSRHIEIPNTKQNKAVERLPFTADDLQKIFPKDYGVDFGRKTAAVDWGARYLLMAI